ncbi:hypothetical protein [Streptococcus pneumoniae]|nr:hypothetical protein [Streptococcus pneumoniae]
MKIKEQTRKLAAGCSKHCFEVMDGLTWFEEIFEESYLIKFVNIMSLL